MMTKPKERLKQIIDRPWRNQEAYKIMDRIVTEFSLYLHPVEVDKCLDFLWTCEQGEFDQNLSVGDCEWQPKIILGSERYEMVREQWNADNQKLLSVFGTLKYKCKKTKKVYDGLDPEDKETDYEKIYV